MPTAPERVAPWNVTATKKFPRAVTVHTSEAELRSHPPLRAASRSPARPPRRITEAYAKGYTLVAVELDSAGATITTPTLRVSDDGAAIVPLALTGNRQTIVRVTATVISEGGAPPAGAPRALDLGLTCRGVRPAASFASARANALADGGGATWIRESSSHEVVFDGVAVPRSTPIQPAGH